MSTKSPLPTKLAAVIIPEVLILAVVPMPAIIPVRFEPSPEKDIAVQTPVTFTVPSTSSFAVGCVEPIPTLPKEVIRSLSLLEPLPPVLIEK